MVEKNVSGTYTQVLYSPVGKTAIMTGQTTSSAYFPLPAGESVYETGSSGGTQYFWHKDWLGSSRFASTVGSRTSYYDRAFAPFGETYSNYTNSSGSNFTGDTQDTISGTYDTPNRELNPNQGRWVSPDPAGLMAVDFSNPQTWNRYAYVTNNPNFYIDPLGLQRPPCGTPGGCGGGDPVGQNTGNGTGLWNFFDLFNGTSGYGCLYGECGYWPIPGANDVFFAYWNGGAQNGPCTNYVMANCGAPDNGVPNSSNSPCSVAVSCDTSVTPHCGITVGESDGSYTQYDGEPSSGNLLQMLNPFSSQPKLIVQALPNSPPPAGGNLIFQAPVSCSTSGCIQIATSVFNSSQYTYSAPFLNSNTYASSATNACGLSVPYPWNVFGAQ
jgi:RHS repeat-associated protein